MNQWSHKPDPWMPADYDDSVIYAIRAFYNGTANEPQQKTVWAWLMHLTGEDDWCFRPGGEEGLRATHIALGKQYVGKQLRKMLDQRVTPKPLNAPVEIPKPNQPAKKKRKRR